MAANPDNLYYSAEHLWIMVEDGIATIGLTEHAQTRLGEITAVTLPEDDADVSAGDEAVTVESIRATRSFACPLSGRVIEINDELAESPEVVNEDAYGQGWLFKLELSEEEELEELMSEEDYEAFLQEEGEAL